MGKKMPESEPAGPSQERPETFEAAMHELEEIVRRMEGSDVSLDESLRLYERGTFLLGHCQQRLDSAEKQIEILTKAKDGRLAAQPAGRRETDG
jgi:exodeoxyribonuclease VII small subunit